MKTKFTEVDFIIFHKFLSSTLNANFILAAEKFDQMLKGTCLSQYDLAEYVKITEALTAGVTRFTLRRYKSQTTLKVLLKNRA